MTEKSRSAVERDIVTRAMKDPEFRRKLVQDPAAVLQAETGLTIPQGMEIRVVEESPSVTYVVLPATPDIDTREVSDEALASVAKPGAIGPRRSWDLECYTDFGYWSCHACGAEAP